MCHFYTLYGSYKGWSVVCTASFGGILCFNHEKCGGSHKGDGRGFGAPAKSAHNTVRLSNSTRALRHEENT